MTWGQDTVAPFAFVTFDAYDEETPRQPVVSSRSVRLRLDASERVRGRREARKEIIVVDRYSGQRRAKVVIRSTTGRQVVLDAIVARSNRFTS